ncbi:MAG: hypothetical protein WCP28_11720 [Actinomycetes bacterium]
MGPIDWDELKAHAQRHVDGEETRKEVSQAVHDALVAAQPPPGYSELDARFNRVSARTSFRFTREDLAQIRAKADAFQDKPITVQMRTDKDGAEAVTVCSDDVYLPFAKKPTSWKLLFPSP